MKIKILKVDKLCVSMVRKIGQGSNSSVYLCNFYMNKERQDGIIKIPPNPQKYISSNIQRFSYELCAHLNDKYIRIPKVYAYAIDKQYGDALILEKMDNIYPVDYILKHELGDGKLIVQLIAKTIANLHQLTISGYDTEFLWDVVNNQLVVLDIGPVRTINSSNMAMLKKHLKIEHQHEMGIWNIISQILPKNRAIMMKENNLNISVKTLLKYMNDYTNHIQEVAATTALLILGILDKNKKNLYIQIFKKTYREAVGKKITLNEMMYLKAFEEAICCGTNYATSRLYNTKTEPLSICSCKVQID